MAKRQSIKDQLAVGRVFELKARHGSREPICVMIVRDPFQQQYGQPIAARIDERGMRRDWHSGRFYDGSMRLSDFTSSKIARRRRDLERFDARDLELIRYGIRLDFTGELAVDSYGTVGLPFLEEFPEVEWTIFSTCHSRFMWKYNNPHDSIRLKDLLRGDWHFYSTAYKTNFVRTEDQFAAWATTKNDAAALAKVESLLRRHFPDLQRSTFAMRGVTEENGVRYRGVGNTGPAVRAGWAMAFVPHDPSAFHGISRSTSLAA